MESVTPNNNTSTAAAAANTTTTTTTASGTTTTPPITSASGTSTTSLAAAADSEFYLGSIFHSLEHLPQWYQLVSLFSVFCLFPLREIAVVGWLAASLHNSFGTEMAWPEEYQLLLEQMSFNERLCFTLYGVALSLLAFLAYRVFASDVLYIGLRESGLTGKRKWWLAAFVCALLGCEGMVILKEEVSSTLSNKRSLAHLALVGFDGIEKSRFDLRLANSNPHFIIQIEVLKSLLIAFLEHVGPAVILSCCYRLLRDVPRKATAALRWYIVTLMLSRSLITLFAMYRNDDWDRKSAWLLFASSLCFLGMVNYAFGPTKRGGWTAATSVVSSIYQTIQGIVKCTALFFVIYLSVLALVVSVHVVELLLIWLIFFLTTVWVPAIIDSCSTDYMVCVCTAICFVAREMNYLTDWGSFRLWGFLCLWWLNVCLFYNLTTNACHSRYGGIISLSVLFTLFWRLSQLGERTGDFVSFLEHVASVSRDLVEGTVPIEGSMLTGGTVATPKFYSLFQAGLLLCGILVGCVALLSIFETPDIRNRLLSQNILIVTPGVLFRKLVKTLILAVCFLIFMVTALLLYNFLPHLARFAPEFATLSVAVGLACIILGTLMDMQEFFYIVFMRLIGVMEPPETNDDDKEGDQNPFVMGGTSTSWMRRQTGVIR
ncbi:uncharacterized protein TM35_000016020 [Trypanosoma theileri]|uniref:Uncharacterized protein n=1 Tax=Trypanosoma theileri TaxID=67003 RepID=A0A1X0PA84_9TRYP|nr:uncharacterized protein TM35_000016020 [Trypanosoma theileri]ORC93725.1 hypothetical protein TM35_000016020 [Trypanosoma theileri]